MANPSKRDSAAKKVVAVARSIVTYQIGLPAGCVRMQRTLSWLAPYEMDLPGVFDEYLKEVRQLPITSERLSWDRKALREADKLLEATNYRFRDRIFDACWALIDRFTDSAPSTRISTSPVRITSNLGTRTHTFSGFRLPAYSRLKETQQLYVIFALKMNQIVAIAKATVTARL
jgi:hypothetical protein